MLCLRSRNERGPALKTLRRPQLGGLVVLVYSRDALRKYNPRLLRSHEDMNVGWETVRIVKCADPYEAHGVSATSVVAPDRYATYRATRDLLSFATIRRCFDDLDHTLEKFNPVGFDHGV